jgi:hypothetical protein
MSTTSLIILMVALAAIFVLRTQRRLALLAVQIRGLRLQASEPYEYEAIDRAELDGQLETATREAERAGLVMLGDFRETWLDMKEAPKRAFTDAEGTTFGWMTPFFVDGAATCVVVVYSHELDAQAITVRQPPSSSLARPPFVRFQTIAPATSIEMVLAKHRAHAGISDPARAFIPVKSFQQLTHELERMRDKARAWRKEQSTDELLDNDLRALLGAQYAKLGEAMKRRVRT